MFILMRTFILFFFLIYSCSVSAQTFMNLHLSNGFVMQYQLSAIDSITYSTSVVGCSGGPSTLTDIDGNIYHVITIGNQCWMKENLKTTHYKNGTFIPNGFNNAAWAGLGFGAYAEVNNYIANTAVFGKLYNWYAVNDIAGLCPANWHVPSDSEWNQLVKFIDPFADTTCISCSQSPTAGGAMKEIGLSHWTGSNIGATNTSGFTALPAGMRESAGTYGAWFGYLGYWWTSSSASSTTGYYRNLDASNSSVYRYSNTKTTGMAVRCVKD